VALINNFFWPYLISFVTAYIKNILVLKDFLKSIILKLMLLLRKIINKFKKEYNKEFELNCLRTKDNKQRKRKAAEFKIQAKKTLEFKTIKNVIKRILQLLKDFTENV
jgi:hypothetical protein